MAKPATLNERRLAFIDNILKGMSLKDAYLKAGFKPTTQAGLENGASKLYHLPVIQKELKRRRKHISYRANISVVRVLEEEKLIAFLNPKNLFDLEEGTLLAPKDLPEEVARACSGIEIIKRKEGKKDVIIYKYKFWDKGKSLERIGRHLGMFEKDNEQKANRIIVMPQEFEKPKDAGK